MLKALRRRANATTVVAVLALLFAMTGGAIAAKRYLITSTRQISPNVLRQLKGGRGAPGPAGSPGAQGAPGKNGANGANGTNGAAGRAGENGVGATTSTFGGEQHGCREGGLEIKSAGTPAFVCNGTNGANGQTGFTKALPSGETETGTWAVNEYGPVEEKSVFVPISFAIPTQAGEGFYLDSSETEEAATKKPHGCEGTLAEPTAPKGKLCVYTEEGEELKAASAEVFAQGELGHFGSSGGYLEFEIQAGGNAISRGTWAVTAP
jgi:hypothetical protein